MKSEHSNIFLAGQPARIIMAGILAGAKIPFPFAWTQWRWTFGEHL